MRPAGEVRLALRGALERMSAPATYLELGRHVPGIDLRSPADRKLVRVTVMNMAKAGEIARAPLTRQVPGICRPLKCFEPARRASTGGADLSMVLQGWAEL